MENWKEFAKAEGFENEKDMLNHLYYVKMLSLSQIGEKFNVTEYCIAYRMTKYGFKRRKVGYGKFVGRRKKEERV